MGSPTWLWVAFAIPVVSLLGTTLFVLWSSRVKSEATADADDIRDRLSIDKVVLTHPDDDHAADLAHVLHGIPPTTDKTVLVRLASMESELARLRHQADHDERRYRLLREYAAQGLAQSKISFRLSLAAAVFGFLVILVGVGLAIAGQGVGVSVVPVAGGAVVDTVAALFFVQDRRTQRTMIDFFDKLREDRKLDEALSLMGRVADRRLKDRLHVLLALHFAGIDDERALFRQTVGDLTSPDAGIAHEALQEAPEPEGPESEQLGPAA